MCRRSLVGMNIVECSNLDFRVLKVYLRSPEPRKLLFTPLVFFICV